MMSFKDIKKLNKDRILAMIGLQTIATTASVVVRSVGLVAIGVAIGAGTALLLAPTSGRELRRDIRRRLRNGVDDLADALPDRMDESQASGI